MQPSQISPEPATARRVGDLDEAALLERIFPVFAARDSQVLLGPGDDTAYLACQGGVLATTDAMVRGADWLDEWSTGQQIGRKAVAQNVADIASMGGITTGLLVTLAMHADTTVEWVLDLAAGIAAGASLAGTSVVGGDLSSAAPGVVMVSITALGSTQGREPVLRSGARPGDVLAVAGTLGRSDAGWALLRQGRATVAPDLVAAHRVPTPPIEQGPIAARSGATSMIDLSDGLVRDAGRVAKASGVAIELRGDLLRPHVDSLQPAVGQEQAWASVLTGGEEHSLLASFPPGCLPRHWAEVGSVRAGSGVFLDGQPQHGGGWDHFAG
ncbi:thiamine-phosphate kinase [Gephyromycinifex aptenodytis]|uniref:thiamine-phosphate kinase n=1 Tax=Gephyromycinifex aptenodytis TaxID=2716227 RepID=UPI001D023B23|nr:thiamine-phosphate kinase [Gephyromycinifex aptenodytis]